jgi:hypothetical protein
MLPYFDGCVPAGFPSPAEDYLETPLDLADFLIENKAATFLMRVDGDSMRDAGILGSEAVERKTGLRIRRVAKISSQLDDGQIDPALALLGQLV